jgi:hypothetical protein
LTPSGGDFGGEHLQARNGDPTKVSIEGQESGWPVIFTELLMVLWPTYPKGVFIGQPGVGAVSAYPGKATNRSYPERVESASVPKEFLIIFNPI